MNFWNFIPGAATMRATVSACYRHLSRDAANEPLKGGRHKGGYSYMYRNYNPIASTRALPHGSFAKLRREVAEPPRDEVKVLRADLQRVQDKLSKLQIILEKARVKANPREESSLLSDR